jgi:hypothetical protein
VGAITTFFVANPNVRSPRLTLVCFPPPDSFTIYFWARTNDIKSGSAPRIVGVDKDRNICFSVRGAVAWLQQLNLVRTTDALCLELQATKP